MRTIRFPRPTSIRGLSFSGPELVRHLLDTDERFTRTAPSIRAAVRIETAVARGEPLEEPDWQLLRDAAESPSLGYPMLEERTTAGVLMRAVPIGRALLPFIDAIVGAELVGSADDVAAEA